MNGTRSPPKVIRSDATQARRITTSTSATRTASPQPPLVRDAPPRPRPLVKAPSYSALPASHATAGSSANGQAPRKILTNLPSSVTVRRPISPVRATTAESSARETRQAKPPFFTAASFSAPRTAKLIRPDLQRAESAHASLAPRSAPGAAYRSRSPESARLFDSSSPTPVLERPHVLDTPPTARGTPVEDLVTRRPPSQSGDGMPLPSTNAEKRSSRGSTLSSAGSAKAMDTPSLPAPRRPRAPSSVSARDAPDVAHQNPHFADVPEDGETLDATTAAAQSSTRRMLDYEIRNTSLMAVNHHLEKETRKQQAELKQLRRQVAELQRHPGASGRMKPMSPGASENLTSDEEDAVQALGDHEADSTRSALSEVINGLDGSIQRALLVSEQLLQDAQRGLAYRPRASEIGTGVRVLLKTDDEEDE